MGLGKTKIKEIADNMATDERSLSSVYAGQAYIGQMISHDIVKPTNPKAAPRSFLPVLNLDSIYDNYAPDLYQAHPETLPFFNPNGTFKLIVDPQTHKPMDVWRVNGQAVIPELRNDENVIVSQLHLFWQRLHNALINGDFVRDAWQARRAVTCLFQLVVLREFLPQILNKTVYQAYFKRHQRYLDWDWQTDPVPDFFSKASFRFGHSVVRLQYQLNSAKEVNLVDLFLPGKARIPEHVIDWDMFFNNAPKTEKFDTYIATAMTQVKVGPPHGTVNIAELNLHAGEAGTVPSGTGMYDRLHAQSNRDAIRQDLKIPLIRSTQGASFDGIEGVTTGNIPLWLYILHEADVVETGSRLGPMGSMLNAEVIRHAIEHSGTGVYCEGQFSEAQVLDNLGRLGRELSAKITRMPARFTPYMRALNALVKEYE